MAVDYFHRLVVSGSPPDLQAFRRAVGHTVHRPKIRAWHECVPLSFGAMYALCPELTRVEPSPPDDPYDLAVWPITSLPDQRAETRYQFHTRNLEMHAFLGPVSSRFRTLILVLVTFCLDDNSITSYLIRKGRLREFPLPEARHDRHWALARRQFRLAGEAIYEHAEARSFVEGRLLDEALGHWERLVAEAWKKRGGNPRARAGRRRRTSRASRATTSPRALVHRRRDWWHRPTVRDLDFERTLAIIDLSGRSGAPTDAGPPRAKGRGRRRS
jgi:hypothetical protein